MTIDEIRALIGAKIAGQGSAVDAGGALPAILDGILDIIAAIPTPAAPLIIKGTFDDDQAAFVPDAGQPDYSQARAAFDAGTVVILDSGGGSIPGQYMVVYKQFGYLYTTDENIYLAPEE